MKNKFYTLVLCFFLFSLQLVKAQTSPGLKSFIPPSPNASSLGKYGEVPVGYYTGIPNISIPLTNLKSRELELPVSLSYHAGGIKVEEMASWVGLGWSLNAGGVITRSVRGTPDDLTSGYFNTRVTMNALGIKYAAYSGASGFQLFSGNGLAEDKNMYEIIMAQMTDAEPDIFYFNFGKFSGKFFMNATGNFVVSPIQTLKIEQVSGSYGVIRWVITTPDGVKYIFGTTLDQSRSALEKTVNEANTVASSGWYLIEIVSPNNDRIDLEYTPENYSFQSKASETINRITTDGGNCNLPPLDKYIMHNTFEGRQLAKMQGSMGSIIFNKSATERTDLPGSYSLESIDIKDAQNTLLKKIKLTYGEFSSSSNCSTGTAYCKRLKLLSVQEMSADGLVSAPQHSFDYSTVLLPGRDPNYTSINSQDMWGFYNGAINSVLPRGGLITYTGGLTQTIFGADRYSDEYFMQAGILKKITYPTGGYTYFDYEANRLYTSDNGLAFTNLEPVAKAKSLTLLTGDTKTADFSVVNPNPSTTMVRITVTNRQQLENCAPKTCFLTYIEGRNATVYTRKYFDEGTSTLDLSAGDYRIGGTTYPGPEALISSEPKIYYLDLNWLEYPTTISATQNEDKIVGGLRIKRISNFSGNGTSEIKTYAYTLLAENKSSGVPVNIAMLNADALVLARWDVPSNSEKRCYYLQCKSATLVPMAATSGSVVGYANITEFIGENGEAGKTEYTFTTALDYPDQMRNIRPFAPATSYDWKRGLLLKKSQYKYTPTGFVKVAESENTYSFGNNLVETFGVSVSKDYHGPDNLTGNGSYYVAGYKTASEFFYLQTEKNRVYDQNALTPFVETTKTSEYGIAQGHYQLTRSTELGSDGIIKEVNIKYPQDVVLTGTAETARQSLISKFMIGIPLEQTTKMGGTQTSKTTTDFKDFYSALTLPNKINFQTVTTAPFEERVNFNSYDDYGNLLEQAKVNDLKNAYQWGYNSSLPTAEVKNASNYRTVTNQLGTMSTNFGGVPGVSATYNFTVGYTGTVTLKLSVQTSPIYTTVASYTGMSIGSITLAKGGCGLTIVTFANVSPGAKTLTITLTTPDNGVSSLGACGQLEYPQTTSTVLKEFYFENFEESGLATTDVTIAHTGKKYYSGDYTVSFTLPNIRVYMIEYWYLDVGNVWKYISKPYSVTTMLLNEGSAIDNVRIYPVDARMKSYTYDPCIGITSVIDENGNLLKYYYDTLGRLLQVNSEKGIEKQYRYNYKTN